MFSVLLENPDQVLTGSQRDERICAQLDSLDSSASTFQLLQFGTFL